MRFWPLLFPLLVVLEAMASVEVAMRRTVRALRGRALALEGADGTGLQDDDLGW